ncbi:hypothetical protein NE237_006927 [Protea cynaroides]|uniref:Uncharacterized protein n=1 Tax=Protea cynaroides TaxID=273540 RepID=A0A9Q0QVR7_9MAGN|nr:hypothetical protein NE237_006927 [Protea cynaroides]
MNVFLQTTSVSIASGRTKITMAAASAASLGGKGLSGKALATYLSILMDDGSTKHTGGDEKSSTFHVCLDQKRLKDTERSVGGTRRAGEGIGSSSGLHCRWLTSIFQQAVPTTEVSM